MQTAFLSIYRRDDDFSFGSVIEIYQPYGLLIALYMIAVLLRVRDAIRGSFWRDRTTIFVIQISIYLAFGLFAALASGRFYDHYSILLLPGLTLAAGTVLARLPPYGRVRGHCAAGILILAVLLSIVPQRATFLHGIRIYDSWVSDAPSGIFVKIANDINNRSNSTKTLYVYQFNSIVYYLTGTKPPTRFPVWFHHLEDRIMGVFGTDPVEQMARILDSRPQFILVGNARSPWNPKVYRILKRELKSQYNRIKRYRHRRQPLHLYERKDQ
jgi:hypothetical protein